MANKTFAIQYLHPEKGLQLAFEVAANAEAAKAKFSSHKTYKIVSCTATTPDFGHLTP